MFAALAWYCRAAYADAQWLEVHSPSFIIQFAPEVRLGRIERNLRRRYFVTALHGSWRGASAESGSLIAMRIEAILSRVKEILGMNPPMTAITVRVYRDRGELRDAFAAIFSAPGSHKSFYVHKLRTIFASEEDLSDSVIAHELGHAVIDHYFKMVPPSRISDLLAVYVDTHLEE